MFSSTNFLNYIFLIKPSSGLNNNFLSDWFFSGGGGGGDFRFSCSKNVKNGTSQT